MQSMVFQQNDRQVTESWAYLLQQGTPQGKLMLTIFAGLAEFEREQMLQRQKEGIEIAKADGKYKGRQPIRVDIAHFEKEYKQWKSGKQTATAAMKALNMKPNTFYRRVKEYEQQQQSA